MQLLRNTHKFAICKGAADVITGRSVGGNLDVQLITDAQPMAWVQFRPVKATDRQVLSNSARRNGMPFGLQRFNVVVRKKAHCTHWPAVVASIALSVTNNTINRNFST